MSSHAHDVQKEVKRYLIVFAALAALTVITVAVSYLHLELHEAVILAMIVATIKGGLVACYFMHLISEKKLIYGVLIFTFLCVVPLPILTVMGEKDTIAGTVIFDEQGTVKAGHEPAGEGHPVEAVAGH